MVNPQIIRSECEALPKGWIREEVPRMNSNILGGKTDIYYISPMGKRIRSKIELLKIMGDVYDLKAFDYNTGTINPLLSRPRPTSSKRKRPTTTYDLTKNIKDDRSVIAPIRQTASIFKQPVTIHKSKPNETKADKKLTLAEKPRQLFWEKRLSGLRPSYPDEDFQPFSLPEIFKAVGPSIQPESVLASISTSLLMFNGPITGQVSRKGSLNMAICTDPNQPLIASTSVSQSDIDKQEIIVTETRDKLALALEAVSG